MRVLVVTWDGGGNLSPTLGIVRALTARGDRVRVLGHAVQRSSIERAGVPFTPIRTGRDYVSAAPRGTVDGVLGLVALFADRGIADDARALIEEEAADVILVDCLLWGAIAELGRTGTPVVSLVHSISAFFRRNARGPLGVLARVRGTDPAEAHRATDLSLVTTRADFEPPGVHRGDEVHTGFVWQEAPVAATAAERPRVLISFSTTVFPGQARVLQRAMDALAATDLDVLVTSGAVDTESLRAPANARVVRHRDHAEILPSTSLVIGHGGHSTTARALTAGIPVLVLPMHPLMDQPSVGRAVARLGAGEILPKGASARRIREAAERLLGDPEVRAAAGRIGVEARARDGAAVAVETLDRLVSAGGDSR